jgi:uncharacterized protein
MRRRFFDLAFTPSVQAEQARRGSRAAYAAAAREDHADADELTEREAAFIAARDSFYLASVSETGWPYVQHRGGPPGFLKVIDEKTLGFADFRGNRQFISLGNLKGEDRTALFLMDYPHRARLKVLAHTEVRDLEDDPALAEVLRLPNYKAKVERAILFHLDAFDWNCPQHITPRFTEAELEGALDPLRQRLADLSAENAALRAQIAARSGAA